MADRGDLADRERRIVAAVFRSGLAVSTALMAAGLVARAWESTTPGPVDLSRLEAMSPAGMLMAFGIVLLAATPAVNVVALMYIWARARQLRLALIALMVVVTLAAAVALG